jgi:hypothetical protein
MEERSMTEVRLGKQGYVHDDLTLMLARFVLSEIRVPTQFDFDKGRAAFPMRMWGNDLLRLERVEQRRTIALYDEDCVAEYKRLTGSQQPEDANDTGLVVLDAMRDWRNNGMETDGRKGVRSARNYTIAAYGELEPQDHQQLKMAIYAMHGIHMGFWLPVAAQRMTSGGMWDYNGEAGGEWQPGSWGGHLVFSKAYDKTGVEILTWGQKVKVTWNFIDKYCDEAWAVVDSFDTWRTKQTIDVGALIKKLTEISSRVNT